jgi:hypothetical protein
MNETAQPCPLDGCEGLSADGVCPNGYGVTCESVFPEPTNMDEDPLSVFGERLDRFERRLADIRSRAERPVVFPITNGDAIWLIERLEAVVATIKDSQATYGLIDTSGPEPKSVSPMMTERDRIVEALDA